MNFKAIHLVKHISNPSLNELGNRLVSSNQFLGEIMFLFLLDISLRSVQTQAVTPKSEKLITAYEIAIVLNISKAKAYQLIQRGEIPPIKFGRTTSVRAQDLEKFLEEHTFHEL